MDAQKVFTGTRGEVLARAMQAAFTFYGPRHKCMLVIPPRLGRYIDLIFTISYGVSICIEQVGEETYVIYPELKARRDYQEVYSQIDKAIQHAFST